MSTDERTAVVTGAGRGIGREVALALARAGFDVAVCARSAAQLDAVVREVEAFGRRGLAVPSDLTQANAATDLIRAVETWSPSLHVLVNNAGGAHVRQELQDVSEADYELGVTLNLSATYRCMRAAASLLFRNPGTANVVNVVSIAAERGLESLSYYSAAKAGVVGMSRATAAEWGPRGVRVNCIAPGWVETDLSEPLRRDDGFYASTVAQIPLRRWGRPAEVACGVAFLASDEASYVNGTTLVMDGGLLA